MNVIAVRIDVLMYSLMYHTHMHTHIHTHTHTHTHTSSTHFVLRHEAGVSLWAHCTYNISVRESCLCEMTSYA